MNRYPKLVNFEMNRFFKIYATLIAITIFSQITGTIVLSKKYLGNAKEIMYERSISQTTFIEEYGPFSFEQVMESLWFVGPIILSIVGLLLYALLIWYRDWFGKNTFIYRLLMIPTARINIYFAKAASIFLMVLGLVAVQLMLLPVIGRLIKIFVPVDFRVDMTVGEMIGDYGYLTILIPNSFMEFVINYGIGFMAVFILFTAILFERSFRLKGIVMGIIYIAIAFGIFLSPMIAIVMMQKSYLYPMEFFILEVFLWLLVTGLSIWISRFLLNKKITI